MKPLRGWDGKKTVRKPLHNRNQCETARKPFVWENRIFTETEAELLRNGFGVNKVDWASFVGYIVSPVSLFGNGN